MRQDHEADQRKRKKKVQTLASNRRRKIELQPQGKHELNVQKQSTTHDNGCDMRDNDDEDDDDDKNDNEDDDDAHDHVDIGNDDEDEDEDDDEDDNEDDDVFYDTTSDEDHVQDAVEVEEVDVHNEAKSEQESEGENEGKTAIPPSWSEPVFPGSELTIFLVVSMLLKWKKMHKGTNVQVTAIFLLLQVVFGSKFPSYKTAEKVFAEDVETYDVCKVCYLTNCL
jgi:hypothetical protein